MQTHRQSQEDVRLAGNHAPELLRVFGEPGIGRLPVHECGDDPADHARLHVRAFERDIVPQEYLDLFDPFVQRLEIGPRGKAEKGTEGLKFIPSVPCPRWRCGVQIQPSLLSCRLLVVVGSSAVQPVAVVRPGEPPEAAREGADAGRIEGRPGSVTGFEACEAQTSPSGMS